MAHELPPVPATDEYRRALARLGMLSDLHLRLLRAHYFAPEHKATATELAQAVGFDNWRPVNLQYGLLGEKLRVALNYAPGDHAQASYSLASFVPPGEEANSEWVWVMHPELAQALETLGWVEGPISLSPQEVAAATALVEGAVRQVLVDTYERNSVARSRCIAHYGAACCICNFDFEAVYGEPGKGYIEVHHLRSLSEIRAEYIVDPIADLRPVCANCHAVIHRRIPAHSMDEVRAFVMNCKQSLPAEFSRADIYFDHD
jgi:5-methylcytosine-specific restriction protein A